jgi:hypothetical protein
MILSTQQILYYVIFILFISIITVYYIKCSISNNEYISSKIYENFENLNNDNYFSDFNDVDISDPSVKNSINKELSTIKSTLNKYSMLDPAIILNNNIVLCDNPIENSCKIENIAVSTDPTCLVNNVSTSCSDYFDEYVNQEIKIDFNSTRLRDMIIVKSTQLMSKIDKKNNDINFILDTLLDKIKIENEQKVFINFNINSLDDKSKLLDKTTKMYEQNENDVNINQINFSNFLSKNNNNVNKINFYYKIIIGIIITIIIVGIFNFFISETE